MSLAPFHGHVKTYLARVGDNMEAFLFPRARLGHVGGVGLFDEALVTSGSVGIGGI